MLSMSSKLDCLLRHYRDCNANLRVHIKGNTCVMEIPAYMVKHMNVLGIKI